MKMWVCVKGHGGRGGRGERERGREGERQRIRILTNLEGILKYKISLSGRIRSLTFFFIYFWIPSIFENEKYFIIKMGEREEREISQWFCAFFCNSIILVSLHEIQVVLSSYFKFSTAMGWSRIYYSKSVQSLAHLDLTISLCYLFVVVFSLRHGFMVTLPQSHRVYTIFFFFTNLYFPRLVEVTLWKSFPTFHTSTHREYYVFCLFIHLFYLYHIVFWKCFLYSFMLIKFV